MFTNLLLGILQSINPFQLVDPSLSRFRLKKTGIRSRRNYNSFTNRI